jgi:hypothetical protein
VPRDLPAPTQCRGCSAQVRWVQTRLGRNIPLELKPDLQGEWVLFEDKALGLYASKFDPAELFHHDRERWASHLRRCRAFRGQAQQVPPPKADATVGLKFPKRPPAPRTDTRPCVKCRERAEAKGRPDPCHRCWRAPQETKLPAFPPLADLEARRG